MNTRTFRAVLRRPISALDSPSGFEPRVLRAARQLTRSFFSSARGRVPGRSPKRGSKSPSRQAEVLLIVPPFAPLYVPSLAVHTLQASAVAAGIRVDVLYTNMLLAAAIGEDAYNNVSWEPTGPFVAERLFCRYAFGLPPLGHNADDMFKLPRMFGPKQAAVYGCMSEYRAYSAHQGARVPGLLALEARLGDWLTNVVQTVTDSSYKIVGCTTTFEQTVCCVAILNRIKQLRRDMVTIIGGANCDGAMAEGVASLTPDIDYVFSGESDESFPAFAANALAGILPDSRIIRGRPLKCMDSLATPRFHEYFDQLTLHLPDSKRATEAMYLTYETSRGCWWGEIQHCTFCGLNASGMTSRRKSADRVIEELTMLTGEHPTRNVAMTDAIMPYEYFTTLLPRLIDELPGLTIFYEEKANLSLSNVLALKAAGINTIQPGIESLSSPMLKRMAKGLHARQNLLLLRYARIAGVRLWWSILCGFPGDRREEYQEILELLPLLHHLPPPVTLWHLIIDRFSPYFDRAEKYGLRNVAPYPAYADFLPASADISKVAYHFVAEYESAADRSPDIIEALGREIYSWRAQWQEPYGKRPELKLEPFGKSYLVIDTRGLPGTKEIRVITLEEASMLLKHEPYEHSWFQDTAVERKLAVVTDGWFVPLCVARVDHYCNLSASNGDSTQLRRMQSLGFHRNAGDPASGLVSIAKGPLPAVEHPLSPP